MLIFLYGMEYNLSMSMGGQKDPSHADNGNGDTTDFPFPPSHHHHRSVGDQFQGIHYDHQNSNLGEVKVEPGAINPIQNFKEYFHQPHQGGNDCAFNTYPIVNHYHEPWQTNPHLNHQSSIPGLLSTHPVVNLFHHNGSGSNYDYEHRGQQLEKLPNIFDPQHMPKNLSATPNPQLFLRQPCLPSLGNNSTYKYNNNLQGIINRRAQNEIEPTLAQRRMAEAPKYEVRSKLGTSTRPQEPAHLVGKEKPCQHCQSVATSFKYFSNKNPNQPRYRCSNCKKDFTYDGKKYKKLMWYSRISSGGSDNLNHVENGPEGEETAKSEDGLGDLNNSRSKEEEPDVQMLKTENRAQETYPMEFESLEPLSSSLEFLTKSSTKEEELPKVNIEEEEPDVQMLKSENQAQETNPMEFESLESLSSSLEFLTKSSTKEEELPKENIDDTTFWNEIALWNDQDGINSLISCLSPPWDAYP